MSTRYAITYVAGDRESGKTTYMVWDIRRKLNEKMYDQAFTNLHSIADRDPRIKYVNYAEMHALKLPTVDGLPRAIIGLDQMPNYMDSRSSASKRNREMSKWVRELRQHGLDFEGTGWGRSEVDRRLRQHINLLVNAQRGKAGFRYRSIERETAKIHPWLTMPWSQARAVWEHFDSTELIEDPTIPA